VNFGFQVLGYRPGDKFGLHHDMGEYDEKTGVVKTCPDEDELDWGPRRLVTCFLVSPLCRCCMIMVCHRSACVVFGST
jgi:hypothetical protein